jgi:hypothetical protein
MARNEDYLFNSGELDGALEGAKHELQREISKAPEDYLLNVDLDEWVAHLVEKHRVEPVVLQRDGMYLEDLGEIQVDVRYDHMSRAIFDMSQPAYVAGRSAELHVPFTGDGQLFQLRPKSFTHNPPSARVAGQEIVKRYTWPTDTARPNLQAQANELTNTIERWISWSREQVEVHNAALENLVRQAIQNRRQRVLAVRPEQVVQVGDGCLSPEG